MAKFLMLVLIIGVSSVSEAKVSRENIQTLVQKLKGGDYSGTYEGKPCSVSVFDNGGSGNSYSVRVSPTTGTENFLADFTVSSGQEGQVGDLGGDSIGVNFNQNLTVVRKPDGSVYVRVSNQIGGETAMGRCTISP